MRSQLIELGFDVPVRKYLFEPADVTKSGPPLSGPADPQTESQHGVANSVSTGVRPHRKYTPYSPCLLVFQLSNVELSDHERSSSARKRKRHESFTHEVERNVGQMEGLRGNSRDLMPPPLPRAANTRQIFSPTGPSSSQQQESRAQLSVQLYRGGTWKQQRGEEQVEQHRDLKDDYRYSSRQRQSQPQTFVGRQYPPPASHQHPEPPSCLEPSGNMYEPLTQIHHYDPVSLAELSLQSSSQDEMLAGDQTYNRPISNYRFVSRSTPAAQNLYRPPHSMLSHHEYNYHANTQSMPPGHSVARDHGMGSRMRHPMEMETPQPNFQQKLGVASSPYFKRGADAIRPATVRRPPARGNDALIRLPANDGQRSTPVASRPVPQTIVQSQNRGESYHMVGYQPAYQRRQIYSGRNNGHRHSNPVPETPRNPQSLFQHPDHPAGSSHHSPTKAQPPNHGRRMTLLPSTGLSIPMSASQDEVLSQIRGVRGISSHRSIPGYPPPAPSYGAPRTLFSAGPRQSLRR